MRRLGAHPVGTGAAFAVRAPRADAVFLCLFDRDFDGDSEIRLAMARDGDDWHLDVPGIAPGQYYGYRAEGEWAPERGLWFDPAKLLVDPYATTLDRRFGWHPALNEYGVDTSALVPRAVLEAPLAPIPHAPPRFRPGGFIYEVNVRGFTMLHPDVPVEQRGTVAALGHPAGSIISASCMSKPSN
jgi:glycogen debranching enzyme